MLYAGATCRTSASTRRLESRVPAVLAPDCVELYDETVCGEARTSNKEVSIKVVQISQSETWGCSSLAGAKATSYIVRGYVVPMVVHPSPFAEEQWLRVRSVLPKR